MHDVAQRLALGGLAHHIQLGHESGQPHTCTPGDGADGIEQRTAAGAGHVLQLLDAARPDATWREVDHAHEAGVVTRVLQQAQVGQRVFDFRAFKKPQSTVHLVGHCGVHQRGFNGPALRVAAVQHGYFLAGVAVLLRVGMGLVTGCPQRGALAPHELADFVHQPARLFKVGGAFVHANGFTGTLIGVQVFAQALAVVGNQVVGRVQYVAVAAVVLLQLDLAHVRKFAQKIGHVAHAGTPEGVNALVVVAHGQHGGFGAHQLFQPRVLQLVGVLELVHQDVPEPLLVVLADVGMVAQQLEAAQHQLAKVHHAFALALVFVQLIHLDLLFRVVVAHGHVAGAHALFLAAGHEPHQLFGRETFVVHVVLFAQPLHGRELVLRVQNLKGLRQPGGFPVRAQQAVAQAVEGAHPHAAHVDGQHGLQARQHFLGGLVGEGDGHQPAGAHLAGLHEPGHARGQHPCFARTGPRQHQRMAVAQGDGFELFGVEAL